MTTQAVQTSADEPPPLDALPTERRNPRTHGIDTAGTLGVLRMLNDEDAYVPGAVAAVLPDLARAVDLAVERVRAGGRVHYFGAGTSGRLGVLDAAELLPTFSSPPDLVVAHHAGGAQALLRAVEDVEDSRELGAADAADVTAQDVVLGLTASGRTPYVDGALTTARERGAATVLVTADPDSSLARLADVLIAPVTGAEAVTGSTRLKAGSAQKLVLNGFSTALMIRLGRTWSNLMVDVVATNAKLRARTVHLLGQATGRDEASCRQALEACDGDLKTALVHLLTGTAPRGARAMLEAHGGHVAAAVSAGTTARNGASATRSLPSPTDPSRSSSYDHPSRRP